MKEVDYYLKKEKKTITKVVIKNKRNTTKLFKISNNNEIIKLLLIEKPQKKEFIFDNLLSDISVDEVLD
ncbi:hypothetical protein PML95_03995 [Vagococcus lutrae]|uniref:Uncharacterized protein n=1 Tax=Vagococcus lutrae TaxID=81947 RepID=A0AAE9XQ08_9ENTE|nr:hypothetical protein [Vagococcus lutrae]WCG23414.1 hypothetical protein PML95_03995 [Vagococcus lutrae]